MLSWPPKDPDEILDYQVDWADADNPRLETGETIVSSDFNVTEGDVEIDSEDFEGSGLTTVWLSGGTAGTRCVVLNRVTTSGGRTYDQSMRIRIRDK